MAHGDGQEEPSQGSEANGVQSHADLDEASQLRFNKLVTKAKELAREGYVRKALELNQKALKIYNSEKLARRVAKMEEYLKEHGSESSDSDSDEMVHMGHGFYLYRDLHSKLYTHQREGVLWMWSLYRKKKGGILGDDMGLGKTIQVIAFLSGMFDAQKIHSVLLVLPVSVIVNWEREFEKWAPGIRLEHFHGGSKKERERSLAKVHRRGGVCLTSYGMLVNNSESLAEKDGRDYIWDYVIIDEGHKIKNPSNKCTKGLHKVGARCRIILTGTPIMNNLKELWALFDWAHQGSLLGTAKTFSMEYDGPITRARQKDATFGEQSLGQEMAGSLKRIIAPFFLRRTKAEVIKAPHAGENGTEKDDDPNRMPSLKRKNDLIVWVYLSETQQKIYEDFISQDDIKELLNTSRSPLTALVTLKKICDHPRLLNTHQCVKLGLKVHDNLEYDDEGELDEETGKICAANRIYDVDNEVLVNESGKMVFLIQLLDNLKKDGHRCLIFSSSRKVLDILQKVLRDKGHRVARLDGTVRHIYEREQIINQFTKDKSYSVFLLTTQVGGVGLTITAADRVVIFDPSWNPATDAQAVDRAFRIGQDKNVVIYRLITCGSIEEKIYRRQIFKDSIFRLTAGDKKNPYRYFSSQELRELFVLDNPRTSTTQQQLVQLHANQRKTDTQLDEHIAFLHSLEMFGISDHDLMFSRDARVNEEEALEAEGTDYIQARVHKAQQMINNESQANTELTEQLGRYPAPEVNKDRGGLSTNHRNNWQGEVRLDAEDVPAMEPLVDPSRSDDANNRSFQGSAGVVISDEEASESDAESTEEDANYGEDKLETSMMHLDIKNGDDAIYGLQDGIGTPAAVHLDIKNGDDAIYGLQDGIGTPAAVHLDIKNGDDTIYGLQDGIGAPAAVHLDIKNGDDTIYGLQDGIGAPAAVAEEVVESPNNSVIIIDSAQNTPYNAAAAQSRVIDLLTPKGIVRPGSALMELPPAKRHSPDSAASNDMDSDEDAGVMPDDSVNEGSTSGASVNGNNSMDVSDAPDQHSPGTGEAPFLAKALGKSSKIIDYTKQPTSENGAVDPDDTPGSPPCTPTKTDNFASTRSPVTPKSGKKLDRSGVKLSVKRRRSVCHNMANLLDADEAVVSPRVVREELDFSPAAVRTSSGSDNMEYDDFMAGAKLHANSTRLFDITMMRPASIDTSAIVEEEPEEEGEEEEEERRPAVLPMQRLDSADTESPIAAVRKKTQQRILSTEDEDNSEESPEETETSGTQNSDDDVTAEMEETSQNGSEASEMEDDGDEENEEEEGEEEEEEEEESEEEESEEEEEELSAEEQQQYIDYMTKSRGLYRQGNLHEALRFCLEALEICSTDERARKYAVKLQQKLSVV